MRVRRVDQRRGAYDSKKWRFPTLGLINLIDIKDLQELARELVCGVLAN